MQPFISRWSLREQLRTGNHLIFDVFFVTVSDNAKNHWKMALFPSKDSTTCNLHCRFASLLQNEFKSSKKWCCRVYHLCIEINMSSNRLAWISDYFFESFLLPQSEQQINLRNLHSLNLQQTWFQRQIREFFKNGFASVTEEKANVPRPRNDWIICGLSLIWHGFLREFDSLSPRTRSTVY